MKRGEQATRPRSTLVRFVRSGLTYRCLPVAIAMLAIVLSLPSLGVGWIADDYYHRMVMLGSRTFHDLIPSPLDMFRFVDGNPERTHQLMDIGWLPWWTVKEIRGSFCRPVTAITHWLDYRLWPEAPALMHAQSILWFGALVAVVAILYRRIMGVTCVAGVAAFLYAIDDAHGTPVGWLANRNAKRRMYAWVVG